MLKLICKSRVYQLSIKTNRYNEDDRLNYSHALARRLPAEVLFDTIHRVTGSKLKIPGVPEVAGTSFVWCELFSTVANTRVLTDSTNR